MPFVFSDLVLQGICFAFNTHSSHTEPHWVIKMMRLFGSTVLFFKAWAPLKLQLPEYTVTINVILENETIAFRKA